MTSLSRIVLSRDDRILGCLLAGALGDAIGAYFEGQAVQRRACTERNTRNAAPFSIPADLRVTDDTQLTIATCESIIESGSVEPETVARHFLRWFRARRLTGIGASTLKALTELDVGGHWAMVGAVGERAAGNGAAMRIAPLAFILDPHVDADRQTIRDICRITHRNDEAYIGALAIVRTIRHVIAGNPLAGETNQDEVLTLLVDSIPDSRVRDRLLEVRAASLSIEKYVSRFAASGYVVDSVPLAILAAIRSSDVLSTIEQIMQTICAQGGDTDTIASMFGQIFGAAFGTAALPMEIVEQINAVSLVRDTAVKFANILACKGESP